MTTLLLRLSAPLQSWGTSSRFTRRNTDRAPSRSGVLGLLAAAQGRRRTDPLEELLDLRIGVRIDQPGQLERDFHTARTRDGSTSMPLSYRFYLSDAVFAVAVEGEPALLESLQQALRTPVFPLFLGRRSCPPAGRLLHGLAEGTVRERLESHPWLASPWVQRRHQAPTKDLDIVVDCPADDPEAELVRDEPISFDPRERRYGWRSVHRYPVTVPNPGYRAPQDATAPPVAADPLDPMAAFEGIA
ncbi:type I-E CRISPR-associated protein Cas5/CasD [Saccharothrix algeriensis]|uniref:CRISPR system Cascade subunit CasD n=1 Tax=Saccharothrix algeriensis TaxID=173560 RepID=A0A8T8HW39_9PSEU|nr:type I-E CRISPR-associated protein Cas5/CasD [Saccharothrix algeriensis]MBM7814400.1 CRISPR system Cascade subunit CasD [Saccharothrix algeriensis]QTR02712.1 type I-E CRISPR-associated protein Cas5/CasD [Saccharothrix algeriensis]